MRYTESGHICLITFVLKSLGKNASRQYSLVNVFSGRIEIFDVYGCILLFSDAFQASAVENDFDVFSFTLIKLSKKPIAGESKGPPSAYLTS